MKTKSIKTVKKTVIKYKLLFFALLFFNLCFSQEKSYFRIKKNGMPHHRKEVYLIFDPLKHEKICNNLNLIFWINDEKFVFSSKDFKAKKISKKPSKNRIVNDKDLIEIEYSVYKEAFKKEGLKMTPPGFVHKFLDIHILERISEKVWIDYHPINWIYTEK